MSQSYDSVNAVSHTRAE